MNDLHRCLHNDLDITKEILVPLDVALVATIPQLSIEMSKISCKRQFINIIYTGRMTLRNKYYLK
jgi:hypothetical protein